MREAGLSLWHLEDVGRKPDPKGILGLTLPSMGTGHTTFHWPPALSPHWPPPHAMAATSKHESWKRPRRGSVTMEDSQGLTLEVGRHFLRDVCLHRVMFLLPLYRPWFQGYKKSFQAVLNNKDYTYPCLSVKMSFNTKQWT